MNMMKSVKRCAALHHSSNGFFMMICHTSLSFHMPFLFCPDPCVYSLGKFLIFCMKLNCWLSR